MPLSARPCGAPGPAGSRPSAGGRSTGSRVPPTSTTHVGPLGAGRDHRPCHRRRLPRRRAGARHRPGRAPTPCSVWRQAPARRGSPPSSRSASRPPPRRSRRPSAWTRCPSPRSPPRRCWPSTTPTCAPWACRVEVPRRAPATWPSSTRRSCTTPARRGSPMSSPMPPAECATGCRSAGPASRPIAAWGCCWPATTGSPTSGASAAPCRRAPSGTTEPAGSWPGPILPLALSFGYCTNGIDQHVVREPRRGTALSSLAGVCVSA